MRHFNMLAAVAVALLASGVAVAQEKPVKPKEKKICWVEEDSTSRIGTRRICRTVTEKDQPRAEAQPEPAAAAETDSRRD
ncbi:MAG TPA: hypothetical protein VFZ91_03565 [Allosphingosinicella sp.]